MKFCITFPQGIESIGKFELNDLGFSHLQVEDRLISFEGEPSDVAKLNLWIRTGQRVFIELSQGNVTTFDDLFELVRTIQWSQYIPQNAPILVRTHIQKHILENEPSVQKIVKKAIISSLTRGSYWNESDTDKTADILVLLHKNSARILLDTSGEPLHKRGYRLNSHEAPIKENLAAGLLQLIRYNPSYDFYDPCAGSGTFGIEAWLLATKTPPGILRSFRFEVQPWASEQWLIDAKNKARENQKPLQSKIYLSDKEDISEKFLRESMEMLNIPKEDILFHAENFDSKHPRIQKGFLCTNPPYGIRLEEGVEEIHFLLESFLLNFPEMRGGIITGFQPWISKLSPEKWKERKLFNGSNEVRFVQKNQSK